MAAYSSQMSHWDLYNLMIKEEAKDKYDIINILQMKETYPIRYKKRTNPVLRVIIDGLDDDNSWFHLLRGIPPVVRCIWGYILEHWNSCIIDGEARMNEFDNYETLAFHKLSKAGDAGTPCEINFPHPENININMMPFIMEETFEKTLLPQYLQPYWENIIDVEYRAYMRYRGGTVKMISDHEVGKIGYLTIQESEVPARSTQRRSGLHTDCPGKLAVVEDEKGEYLCLGKLDQDQEAEIRDAIDSKFGPGYCKEKLVNVYHPWGMGITRRMCDFHGGIYMASTVANSCSAWNIKIGPNKNGEEIIGSLGDLEHLRHVLPGKPQTLSPNIMYWMTDRTPHETLPVKEKTYRQYFRLVTGDVSLWFEEHSTRNPNGVVPDPQLTKIIKYSKFQNNLPRLLGTEPESSDEEPVEDTPLERYKRYFYYDD